jgi:hypothetical protein
MTRTLGWTLFGRIVRANPLKLNGMTIADDADAN